ncbi:hypothetical protein AVEN_65881-1 [Araneus ventricosus]|uniref:Uncharacterized protein n=1 Tax=Araneus ventricosus TaxID=182803 RepID=A0A4Y2HE76_ARAVE|nr:hypothetical protein AVEN_65881-1 [Araneus ventricosus]
MAPPRKRKCLQSIQRRERIAASRANESSELRQQRQLADSERTAAARACETEDERYRRQKQLMLKEQPLLELLKPMMKCIGAKQLMLKELPLVEHLKLPKKFSGPNLFFLGGSAGIGQTFAYMLF